MLKKNEELKAALEHARALAEKIARESGNADPMEIAYLNLALELVDRRVAFIRRPAVKT